MPASHPAADAPTRRRPDLSRRALLCTLGLVVLGVVTALLLPAGSGPGASVRQSLAMVGSLLLLTPIAFAVLKRSGASESPPTWFVVHVLASATGCVLAAVHAAAGELLSPPGLLLVLLVFVVVQGLLARALVSPGLASRFAAAPDSFTRPDPQRRAALARLIAAKQALLGAIDATASEALFSPTVAHWWRHPLLCLRYQRLASEEARLVGSRAQAGHALGHWRTLHIAAAWLFVAGLVAHVVVVTFFAGYVAGGRPIDWWHVSAWGVP